jgi:hypothetical protein
MDERIHQSFSQLLKIVKNNEGSALVLTFKVVYEPTRSLVDPPQLLPLNPRS